MHDNSLRRAGCRLVQTGLCCFFVAVLFPVSAQQQPLVVNPDDVVWGPPGGGNGYPVGLQTARLGVDPDTGGITYLARFPAGSRFDLHWHTHDEFVMVVRGQVALQLGTRDHALVPGSYVVIPGTMNHSWDVPADTDVVILVRRAGPADFHFTEASAAALDESPH